MAKNSDFECFEKQFMELIGEFQSLRSSGTHLQEMMHTESTRAEAAEAAKDAAERAAADARSSANATSAAAARSAHSLAAALDEIVTLKMKLELSERQQEIIEAKCAELVNHVATLDTEVQQLRPIQSVHSSLKLQYIELLDRINSATKDANSECSRLANELRRVEKCASAGSELRERARLAAAAHERARRASAAAGRRAVGDLRAAKVEISRLGYVIHELQYRLTQLSDTKSEGKDVAELDRESLVEVRAALEAERGGAARLQRALAAAVADNASLAAQLHAADNITTEPLPASLPESNRSTNICPIDSFLEDCLKD